MKQTLKYTLIKVTLTLCFFLFFAYTNNYELKQGTTLTVHKEIPIIHTTSEIPVYSEDFGVLLLDLDSNKNSSPTITTKDIDITYDYRGLLHLINFSSIMLFMTLTYSSLKDLSPYIDNFAKSFSSSVKVLCLFFISLCEIKLGEILYSTNFQLLNIYINMFLIVVIIILIKDLILFIRKDFKHEKPF
ncbi:MAG: hypothetical protein E6538_13365 [Paeniclostridium sordellii]|nr:hypothetical protein [Paeniclostridium sordellii]